MDKSSLLFWYPRIKNLSIPQPRTETILLTEKELNATYNEQVPKTLIERTEKVIAQKFQLPVFIRTDLSSAKHYWKKSCFYDGTNELWKHLWKIVEFNLCADLMGLPFEALIIREYIPMDSRFTAFRGDMPVNPERRYFIDRGKILCHHPYWFKGAIMYPSIKNWESVLEGINAEYSSEVEILTEYAQRVGRILLDFWSVDFSKTKDRRWVLIDCALGEKSWHPEDCKFNRTEKIDYMAGFKKT